MQLAALQKRIKLGSDYVVLVAATLRLRYFNHTSAPKWPAARAELRRYDFFWELRWGINPGLLGTSRGHKPRICCRDAAQAEA